MEKRDVNGLTEKEFLEQYNPGNWERPSVTVDIMVLRMKEDLSCLQTLLIKRGGHPYLGTWSICGGFVDMKESAYSAALRELKEETNLENVYLQQVYTMTQPNRDPRMRVISIAYMALLPYGTEANAIAGDDAKDVAWFDVEFNNNKLTLKNEEKDVVIKYDLLEKVFKNGRLTIKNYVPVSASDDKLAFDHSEVLLEGLMKLKDNVEHTDLSFNLVPEEFTLPDLQKVYEVILGKDLYKANFREKIESRVVKLNKASKPLTSKKPAQLYKYKGV
jgi:ADP-ribose pyrophosphatase YjhB (NUDIX family)